MEGKIDDRGIVGERYLTIGSKKVGNGEIMPTGTYQKGPQRRHDWDREPRENQCFPCPRCGWVGQGPGGRLPPGPRLVGIMEQWAIIMGSVDEKERWGEGRGVLRTQAVKWVCDVFHGWMARDNRRERRSRWGS